VGCGVQTGAGAVWSVLKPRAGSMLVVLGAAAVGSRAPLHRLISTYPFADIDQAVRDMSAGKTIKPVLTF
jgi:Zn-dependent alcohol dehydrogenase